MPTRLMAAMAVSVSAYAVSRTRRASGYISRAWTRNWVPLIAGMRSSTRNSATAAPDQEPRPRAPPLLQFPGRLQRFRARARLDDAVIIAEMSAQIATDRVQHLGVVIDGEHHR